MPIQYNPRKINLWRVNANAKSTIDKCNANVLNATKCSHYSWIYYINVLRTVNAISILLINLIINEKFAKVNIKIKNSTYIKKFV